MFVALRGGYVDGHDFLAAARAAGAAVAVVEIDTPSAAVTGYTAVVRVPDTRAALAQLADNFYEHPARAAHHRCHRHRRQDDYQPPDRSDAARTPACEQA